jgi:26S proteasome regulatory subunit N11
VVGWYHSHPGFGCWLSSVDINTQQSFEQLTPRAVAVVVDPIQSVKGKVVIDAFRLINPQTLMMGHEPRQTTSNLGHLNKPSIQALIHGLNRHYYSIAINYRKTALEENMLMNLHKHVWTEALQMDDFRLDGEKNKDRMKRLVGLAEGYEKRVKEETELTKDQLKTRYVGKADPKKRKYCLSSRVSCFSFSCLRGRSTLPLSLKLPPELIGLRVFLPTVVSMRISYSLEFTTNEFTQTSKMWLNN